MEWEIGFSFRKLEPGSTVVSVRITQTRELPVEAELTMAEFDQFVVLRKKLPPLEALLEVLPKAWDYTKKPAPE